VIPRGMHADRLLVIIDFSWWLNLAFRVAGVEGMAPIVVGRLVELLRGDVAACIAVALDSVGPTWRHDLTAGLPDVAAYKGSREPKPREFYALSNRLIDVVRMHRIPILAAEGWEADDAIATAVPLARALDLDVAILTADKDLGQLVGDGVVLWDGADRVRGRAEMEAEWLVPPELLGDLLAIVGDSSDNVRGVEGLGPTKAADLLLACGDLETALALPPEPVSDDEVKAAERAVAAAKRAASKATATGADHQALDVAKGALERVRERRKLAANLATLQAHASEARLARQLVQLDAAAPIEWCPEELPVGGYDVAALRRAYLSLGFHHLAAEVRAFPKAALAGADEEEPREARREATTDATKIDSGDRGRQARSVVGDEPGLAPAAGRRVAGVVGEAPPQDRGAVPPRAVELVDDVRRAPGGSVPLLPRAEPAAVPGRDVARVGAALLTEPAALCGAVHSDGVTACERLAEHVHGPTPADRAHIGGGRSWISRPRLTDEQRAHTETALARGAVERATYPIAVRDTLAELLDPKHLPACDPAVRAELIADLRTRPCAAKRSA